MKNKFLLCSLVLLFLILVVSTNANQNIIKVSMLEDSSVISTTNIESLSEEKIDVIVNFKEKIDENLLKENDVEVKENLKSIEVSTIRASVKAIKEIQKYSSVESVELDLDLELFGESEGVFLNEQILPWGIVKINAPDAWSKATGKNIKIAVIDSGVNKNHPDLKGNVIGGVSFVNETNYWDDDLRHGTSVAGVISALDNNLGVVGVAPNSEIYSVKVIGLSGGKLSNFIQGIQWAIDNEMDVIVMSLGISVDSPSLRKITDEAYLNGIILVAGSGKNNEIYYPAKYSSVIAVGSIDENNELTNENGNGEELEFVAPGKNIISTDSEGYGVFDGTSMATPHVAGVIALLKENFPSLTPNEIRGKLQRSAIDLGSQGKDNYFGYGLVNINLEKENLEATIQIVFPEELNEMKKEEYEINPVKIEIVKIEEDKKYIVQTLFYDGNEGTQNISVESGEYKINQYFDDRVYSNEYVINEGEIIVVLLYDEKTGRGEFIVDAPWRIEPGESIPILFQIRDRYAGSFFGPYSFYSINLYDENNGGVLVKSFSYSELGLSQTGYCFLSPYGTVDTYTWHYVVYVDPEDFNKDENNNIKINAMFDGVSCKFDGDVGKDSLTNLANEPFRSGGDYLTIHVDSNNLLKFNNWFCGDTHYHSSYTDTKFPFSATGEFGGPLDATIDIVNAIGLDWVTVTDHSNSFTNHKEDELSWDNFKVDCSEYEQCLIGTEINCNYTSLGNGNHLLAYDYTEFIDDFFTSDNMPTNQNPSCEEVINNINSQGGFTYPAHPESNYDVITGYTSLWATWHDYSLPFTGLQIWNQDINNEKIPWYSTRPKGEQVTEDLEAGLEKWKDILLGREGLEPRKVFISAGSDAHGDFQDFGKEYTCVYAPYYSKENIFSGLRHGNSYMGNNGALKFEISTGGTTAILGETIIGVIRESATFTVDYNLKNSCRLKLYEGIIGNTNETVIYDWSIVSGKSSKVFNVEWGPGDSYYRVDCIDDTNRLYTNPIWVASKPFTFDAETNVQINAMLDPSVSEVVEGEEVIIIITLNNTGEIETEYNLSIMGNEGWSNLTLIEPETVILDVGETGEIKIYLNLSDDSAGIQAFIVKIDYDGKATEQSIKIEIKEKRIPPEITILSPINNSWSNVDGISINIYTSRTSKWINYSLNSEPPEVYCEDCDGKIVEEGFGPIGEGFHTFTVYASNYFGDVVNKSVKFYIDTQIPQINLTAHNIDLGPESNLVGPNSPAVISYEAYDETLYYGFLAIGEIINRTENGDHHVEGLIFYSLLENDFSGDFVWDAKQYRLKNDKEEGEVVVVFQKEDGIYEVDGRLCSFSENGNSSEDSETNNMKEFNECLAENGMVIYGANWCNYTMQVVETLGGYDVVGDVYVECTENQELCSQEEIQGYPTIRINGEDYQGERTLEAFAELTSCEVPEQEEGFGGSDGGGCALTTARFNSDTLEFINFSTALEFNENFSFHYYSNNDSSSNISIGQGLGLKKENVKDNQSFDVYFLIFDKANNINSKVVKLFINHSLEAKPKDEDKIEDTNKGGSGGGGGGGGGSSSTKAINTTLAQNTTTQTNEVTNLNDEEETETGENNENLENEKNKKGFFARLTGAVIGEENLKKNLFVAVGFVLILGIALFVVKKVRNRV